jgi:aryl-alcohol dehydrogenase-like predicted oxidoreductase
VTFGREIDRIASFALMDRAAEHGVTFFDTAAAYAGGKSEALVGEWLATQRGSRDRFTIATKLLPPYSAARVELGLGESLTRLQLTRIDLLFLHQWHASALEPEVHAALGAMVRSGRVRAIGASNFTAAQLAETILVQTQRDAPGLAALQNIHNFAVRGFDAPTRELCARAKVQLVGYSPLGAGFLTGKHRAGVAPGSRFALMPGHQPIYLNAAAEARLGQLEHAARASGIPLARLALAWALRDPQVGTVLVGGRDRAHLDQAFAALADVTHDIFTSLDNT